MDREPCPGVGRRSLSSQHEAQAGFSRPHHGGTTQGGHKGKETLKPLKTHNLHGICGTPALKSLQHVNDVTSSASPEGRPRYSTTLRMLPLP